MKILEKIRSFFATNNSCCADCHVGRGLFAQNEIETAKSLDPNIVVGLIESILPHPDPKVTKVRITQTRIGPNKVEQVLCGGSNIRENQLVAVATVGADLGGGFVIGERAIRGEVSRGMICSRSELGLSDENEAKGGIWELPEDFRGKIGTKLKDLA